MFYKYLFYSMYTMAKFLGWGEFRAYGTAYSLTTLLPWFNFLSILYFIEIKTGHKQVSASMLLAIFCIYLVITFIYFRYDRSMRILEAAENTKRKPFWNFIVISYICLSVIAFFILFNYENIKEAA